MDLQEVGCRSTDFIDLDQDRYMCWDLFNTVFKIWGSINFLTEELLAFQKGLLPHGVRYTVYKCGRGHKVSGIDLDIPDRHMTQTHSVRLRHDTVSNCTTSGFGGLEVACWPLVPKIAGSHPGEAVGFLGRKKSSTRLPSEGK